VIKPLLMDSATYYPTPWTEFPLQVRKLDIGLSGE